ncbi:MAG: hypothetical protein NC244_07770 [Alistipes senegalensis]|nr:hypothetical protein [Alistipes senegalensis]
MAAKKNNSITKSVSQTKKETTVTENTTAKIANAAETQEVSSTESPVVSFKAKKAIPMDALVMVKSAIYGKLIYISKRIQGYKEVWSEFGEEIPMEMAELYSMKNTDRKFFTENWIEVDPIVLRDLQMERYYTKSIPIDSFNSLFELSATELETKIDNMKEHIRNAFVLEAMKRIEEGTLSDLKIISLIEKKLNCELYEH